ncbi:MAG: hypothetical protein ACQEW5_16765 [Bacillota bacterium]
MMVGVTREMVIPPMETAVIPYKSINSTGVRWIYLGVSSLEIKIYAW